MINQLNLLLFLFLFDEKSILNYFENLLNFEEIEEDSWGCSLILKLRPSSSSKIADGYGETISTFSVCPSIYFIILIAHNFVLKNINDFFLKITLGPNISSIYTQTTYKSMLADAQECRVKRAFSHVLVSLVVAMYYTI